MQYLIILLGFALAVSPWVFGSGTTGTATLAVVVVGALIVAAATVGALRRRLRKQADVVVLLGGLFAVLAPPAMQMPQSAQLASVAIGLAVTLVAGYQIFFAHLPRVVRHA